jgi:hypothetical protein
MKQSTIYDDFTQKYCKTVVWSVWAVTSIALLVYVIRFSYNLPYYDDWNLVPLLDGSLKLDAEWLWYQHNAHRIPFPKLVLVSLLSVTGWDFRSGMFLNALALIFVSALLLRTSAHIRGFAAYTDLFFPVFLLHWGNFDYLLWNWQLNQTIPVIIVLAILSVMLTRGLHPDTRALMFSSVGVVLLPLSGVNGLAYTPGLATWLLLAGIHAWRSGTAGGRLSAIIAQCSGALSLLLIPAYFRGLHPSAEYSGEMGNLLERSLANLPALASTAAHFVAQGLGPGAVALAPFTLLVVPGLILICLAGVLKLAWKERISRHFGIAALLFLVGLSGLVSAVSISLIYNITFPSRYALQAAPVFSWMFLASARNKEFFPAKYVQLALALLSVVVVYSNSVTGLEYARMKDQQFSAFLADIQKGNPPSQVIARHQRAIFPYPEEGGASFHDSLGYWFGVLHHAGHEAFANLGTDPVFKEVPVEQPSSLAEKSFVYGIRVEGYPLQAGRWKIAVSWNAGVQGSSVAQRCFYWNPLPNPQDRKFEKFTCWVYEEVGEIKIEVSPSVEDLRSLKVSLLIPSNQ